MYSSIRSKTTTLPRCARHHSAQRGCSSSQCRGDESAGKRSHRNCSFIPERVRHLQPLLPCPQKIYILDLRLRSKTTLIAQSFLQRPQIPWPTNGPAFRSMLSPSRSATAGIQASQGTTAQAYSNSPPLEEPTVGVRVIPAAESSPVADPLETPSLKRTARYGIHGSSYGPCMCGRSTGAFRPPRVCPKHYGRS